MYPQPLARLRPAAVLFGRAFFIQNHFLLNDVTLFADLAPALIAWQRQHGRHHLPWQHTRDPYRVWLSEVMLQQTQVSTVLGYYQRFTERFPSVAELAAAHPDEVMALWSGLGYYSRARNLHRCAQQVVVEHGGVFPHTAEQLQRLPGIGRSTAAAIAAFCFGQRVAILDANVRRVLTRVLAWQGDLASVAQQRALWDVATDLLPHTDLQHTMPAYTQGLMDLGASVCMPRHPQCNACPLRTMCRAYAQGDVQRYPIQTRKTRRTQQSWWLLVLQRLDDDGAPPRLWLQRRSAQQNQEQTNAIWAGLFSPPVYVSEAAARAAALEFAQAQDLSIATVHALAAQLHVLTHRDLYLHPLIVRLDRNRNGHGSDASQATSAEDARWFAHDQAAAAGLPAPVRKMLDVLFSPI